MKLRTGVVDETEQAIVVPEASGQDYKDGAATQERIAARKGLLLESSGSFGYDRGLKSEN